MMLYHGWIDEDVSDEGAKEIIAFLREALHRFPSEFPCRGPEHFPKNGYEYRNSWFGDLGQFSGSEVIRDFKDPVFHCNYVGGLVDQHP